MKRGIQSIQAQQNTDNSDSEPPNKRRKIINTDSSKPQPKSRSYVEFAFSPIIYCKNIISTYLYPEIDSCSITTYTNIWKFRDQLQVSKMIEFYESKALTSDSSESIGVFNNRPIIDRPGQFLFQFVAFVVIDKNKIQQQTLSTTLESWLLDILAFLLITKTPINFESLKTAIPLNHLQRHWTMLVAEFKISDKFLETFQNLTNSYNEVSSNLIPEPNEIDHIKINEAKNFILDFQNQYEISLLALFKSIKFNHMDSINHKETHNIVYLCLDDIMTKNESSSYAFINVANQQGHTCAEHSTLNGYLFALENASKDTLQQDMDSTELRNSMNKFI